MKLLSIAEIAKILGLPESTVHYYRKRFDEYIPSVGEGRHRRYKPEAVEVLRFIASLVRDGLPADDVKEALAQRFPVTVEQQRESTDEQQQAIQQRQSTTTMLQELMNDAISQAIQQQTESIRRELELLRREIAVTQAENKQLQTQLEERLEQRDKMLMETLRALTERAQEQAKRKKWWRFGK